MKRCYILFYVFSMFFFSPTLAREKSLPGTSQHDPLFETRSENGWKYFENVPSGGWYDPPTPFGFKFEALGDTKFTIVDFPVGLDTDNTFTVRANNQLLGEYQHGSPVHFEAIFGEGVSSFEILDIELRPELPDDTGFPFALVFEEEVGSFRVHEISASGSESFPEPSLLFGLLVVSALGVGYRRCHNRRSD